MRRSERLVKTSPTKRKRYSSPPKIAAVAVKKRSKAVKKSSTKVSPENKSPLSTVSRESPLSREKSPDNTYNIIGRESKYKIINSIGKGSFGEVWLAKNQKGKEVAIKTFFTKEDSTDYEREYHFGRLLKRAVGVDGCNPYVVCFLDEGVYNKHPFIVYELMDGDLEHYQFASLEEILTCMHEACKGLLWIHQKKLAHGDIKPENLLYKKISVSNLASHPRSEAIAFSKAKLETRGSETVFKVGDIGGSCSITGGEKDFDQYESDFVFECVNGGSIAFSAPEVLTHRGKSNTYKNIQLADIFSLGVTFFYIIQKFLHPADNDNRENKDKRFPYTTRKGKTMPYKHEILLSFTYGDELEPLTQPDIHLLKINEPNESKDEDKDEDKDSAKLIEKIVNSMLQVNPKKRIGLQEIINLIEEFRSGLKKKDF